MPDGYCQILKGDYVSGMDIEIIELSGSQYEVTDIVVDPKPDDLASSTEEKKVKFNIPPGVTEVTFTNKLKDTGFLEICKTGNVDGDFDFNINHSNGKRIGRVTVPNYSCSPALEVQAGVINISEGNNPNAAMLGCKTFPITHQLECDLSDQISTVQVLPGDKSKQTIAYIDNEKQQDLENRMLSDFLGVEDDKGKPDLLLKHLRRVQKIRDYSNQLTKFLKLPVAPKIEALLLFRNPVPMIFAWGNVTSESAISTLANFESFLTNHSR